MNHPNDPKGAVGATKCPLQLLPPSALRETAWVHAHGAKKYGPYNWRESKVNATTYVAAIMRHLAAWQEGEDLDPESGRSHLAHIAASANILMDAKATGTLVDDRYKRRPPERTVLENFFENEAKQGDYIDEPSATPDTQCERCGSVGQYPLGMCQPCLLPIADET